MQYKTPKIMSTTPKLLQENDKVAIVSSARKITLPQVLPTIQLLASWGLNPVVGQTIGKNFNQFAGTDKERAEEFQKMLDDDSIKAIFCARGGYGSARILDLVDFSSLKKNPKWIIGYSDVTAILSHVYYRCGIEGVHGIMAINIQDRQHNVAVDSLKQILFEGKNTINADYHFLNTLGCAEGELIGGNLSVLYSLLGSESFGDTKDKILIIEDLDEYLYHIDRMVLALRRANKLGNLKALLVGAFTDMHDNETPFGLSAEQIIKNVCEDLKIPVAFNVPVGHIGTQNNAFIYGRNTKVEITDKGTKIEQ